MLSPYVCLDKHLPMRYTQILIFILLTLPGVAQDSWSLERCVEHAISNNISIKQSELNLDIAEVNVTEANAGFLPNLNAQGGYGFNWGQRIDPFTNQFASERIESGNIGIATSVTLFGGFRQWHSRKQAQIAAEASRWNVAKMKNDIALNVATAFLNVVVNREVEAIAQYNLNNTEVQVERLTKLVAAGQLAEGNLNDLLAQRAADEANLIASQNNVYLAKLQLIQLLQLENTQPNNFEIVVPQVDDMESMKMISSVELVVSSALNNFPEIKSAEANVLSSEYASKLAKAGAYPTLNASYTYGSGYSGAARVLTGSPDSLSFPVGQVVGSGAFVFSLPQPVFTESDYSVKSLNSQLRDNRNQSLFFNLTIPLFNGLSNRSAIKRAEINRKISDYQLEQTRLTLRQNVERAYADATAALSNYNAAKYSLETSEKAMTWAQTRYEQGVINMAEYNDARTRLDNAKATLLRNKYDYLFKLKVLDFYMGQPILGK